MYEFLGIQRGVSKGFPPGRAHYPVWMTYKPVQ